MSDGKQVLANWRKAVLDDVVAVLRLTHGVDVSWYEESFLAKTLEKRRQVVTDGTPSAYLERLAGDGAEAEELSRSLRVSYSEFFRNPLAFALLEHLVLPVLIEERARNSPGELRIWSAGCATGQEAWSLAILLDELAASREKPVPFRIFATDLGVEDLTRAREGIYGPETVGNIRHRHLREYFLRQGESFAVAPRLRERVEFSRYDLLDASTVCPPSSIYGHFDLILCSNVLLYYRVEVKRFILNKLRRCLVAGGYLLTGEAERQIVGSAGGFRPVALPASVFQKVDEAKGG